MLVPGRTSAYAPRPGTPPWRVSIPNFDTYGATSLFTTVGDLLQWEANLDNPVVGDRALFAEMETPGVLVNGDTTTYGFGLVNNRYRGVRAIGHGGADAGYRADVVRFPDQRLAIAVLCNAASAAPGTLSRNVADVLLGSVAGPATNFAMPTPFDLSPALLRRRAGVYLQPNNMQVMEFTFRDGKLWPSRQSQVAFVPVSETVLRVPGQAAEAHFLHGEDAGFEMRAPGVRPMAFERQKPPVVTRAALAAFGGDYVSDELGGTVYRVAAGDSTLSLRTGTANPIVARPVFADGFSGGGYVFQFRRSGGKVTGFEVTNARMRRVKFVKKPN
jgi:hypothetical protein